MKRRVIQGAIAAVVSVCAGIGACAQSPAAPQPGAVPVQSPRLALTLPTPHRQCTGGKLHGHVKSGAVPLPGVTVTAQNSLTGKRYSTTTDLTGAWSLAIPQNGRYVIRTQFAAFAQSAQEALLNASNHDQDVEFQLMLASRAAQQQQREDAQAGQVSQAIRQMASNGAQALNLVSALTGDTESQGGSGGASGAALPSIAGNADFSDQSVAISGQSGSVSPLAGVDMDRLRDAMETMRAQGGMNGDGGPGGGLFGGRWVWRRRIRWRRIRWRRIWWRSWRRRSREFPQLQSRAAARSDFLDGQQFGAECGTFQPARPIAAAAGIGDEPVRTDFYQRALYPGADEAERQRHGVSDAVGIAQFEPAG